VELKYLRRAWRRAGVSPWWMSPPGAGQINCGAAEDTGELWTGLFPPISHLALGVGMGMLLGLRLSQCCAHIMQPGQSALWSWPTPGELGEWKWPTSSGNSSTYSTYGRPCRDAEYCPGASLHSVIGEVPWSSRPVRLLFTLHNFRFAPWRLGQHGFASRTGAKPIW